MRGATETFYFPVSIVQNFCEHMGIVFSLHLKNDETSNICDAVLSQATGNTYFFRDYSVDFEGLTLIKNHVIEMHVLTSQKDQVPGCVFLHELGHVVDYFQIANCKIPDQKALETIREAESALVDRIGESAFRYLSESVADYYAILIAALLDVTTKMRLSVLEKILNSYLEEETPKDRIQLMYDQFYLEHNPTQLARIDDPLYYYRYTIQRIRTTEELFTHVNYCLKYNMLTGFEGLKKEMELYFPYIRDYCGKEIAVIDLFGKLEGLADALQALQQNRDYLKFG